MLKRISKKQIENLTPVAEGFKVVQYNGMPKHGKTGYGKKIVGNVYRCDGDLTPCKNGIHFCKNPADVFDTYEPLGYNRYFRVRAYENCVDSDDGSKSVTNVIEFVDELSIQQYIDLIKSDAVTWSDAVNGSDAVTWSNTVSRSTAVTWSNAVNESTAVTWSNAVNGSNAVNESTAVTWSDAVTWSNAVNGSNAVNESTAVTWSNAVYNSYAIDSCNGIFKSAFCYKINGAAHCIFNKQSDENRCAEIIQKLKSFDWQPAYYNWDECYINKNDKLTFCPYILQESTTKNAWTGIPDEMLEYITHLPEFDAEIFKKITGIDVETDE